MGSFRHQRQSGFTLIELVIVIVIIGILAAVAIPKLQETSVAARDAVQDAVVGALKSAWTARFAIDKAVPTVANLAAAMSDPPCPTVSGNTIQCTGITLNTGSGLATFTYTYTANATTANISVTSR